MVRLIVGSILHGGPIGLFLVPASYPRLVQQRYPVCGMMHIKDPLQLIKRIAHVVATTGFLSLSEWSFTVCPTPYNRIKIFPSLHLETSYRQKTPINKPTYRCMSSCVTDWREREMFYLTTHSTHFIYGYMASDMVKDHSDSEKGNPLPPHMLLID